MNILLIILVILLTPFILVFSIGFIMAAISGSDKKRRSKAIVTLSQMTEEQRNTLLNIYKAYKTNNVDHANKTSKQSSPDIINFLVDFFDYSNRPQKYSSGKVGMVNWLAFIEQLKELGYSEEIAKIIPIVIMDNYNDVLEKMIEHK